MLRRGSSIFFFGIVDFPHLKLGIRDFKAKSERDLGLKACAGGGMPKITLGITRSTSTFCSRIKVARLDFLGLMPPKFEH